ncbi:MAG: tRNA epoxyqueuosine(34) reductase QueG [Gemmataceae bacterium]|nr:tRNA epoxyqueuosine(34) reductase QueG [Gemmataceae bacterium]
MGTLEEAIRENSRALGFSLVGIARAVEADDYALYRAWVEAGYAGEMGYLTASPESRRHPRSILPTVRSVVMVGMEYTETAGGSSPDSPLGARVTATASSTQVAPGTGPSKQSKTNTRVPVKVSRYALGRDYHQVIWERLRRLLAWMKSEVPECEGRVVVDTAPLLERDFARRAGLGWIGKNTMLINKRIGSYFFLGALLTNLELAPDPPHAATHCGTCTACLTACPTSAFVAPGRLDARRCISYLTIELRGPIPEPLRPALEGWLFGCDICQEVCPWNRHATLAVGWLDALEMVGLSEEAFQQRFRGTALQRAKRRGLVRNAALLLGERGDQSALDALQVAAHDSDPVVREAASWAISRLRERLALPTPSARIEPSASLPWTEKSVNTPHDAAVSLRKDDGNS